MFFQHGTNNSLLELEQAGMFVEAASLKFVRYYITYRYHSMEQAGMFVEAAMSQAALSSYDITT
jgi:hypothetical protein